MGIPSIGSESADVSNRTTSTASGVPLLPAATRENATKETLAGEGRSGGNDPLNFDFHRRSCGDDLELLLLAQLFPFLCVF